MNATPIHSGTSLRALERAKSAAYRRRCETMAAYHDAEAAWWRRPSVAAQEAVDVALTARRKAQREYAKAREQLDQAQELARAAAA